MRYINNPKRYRIFLSSLPPPLSIFIFAQLITRSVSNRSARFLFFCPCTQSPFHFFSVICLFYPPSRFKCFSNRPSSFSILSLLFSLQLALQLLFPPAASPEPLFELPPVSGPRRLPFSFFASVPAEWVAGADSVCPLSSPSFHHCQSTELTWVFGRAGEGWNFEEEAPANLAQNAAFPP